MLSKIANGVTDYNKINLIILSFIKIESKFMQTSTSGNRLEAFFAISAAFPPTYCYTMKQQIIRNRMFTITRKNKNKSKNKRKWTEYNT